MTYRSSKYSQWTSQNTKTARLNGVNHFEMGEHEERERTLVTMILGLPSFHHTISKLYPSMDYFSRLIEMKSIQQFLQA